MRVALISKPGHFNSGVNRYARELEGSLSSQGYEVVHVHPVVPLPQCLLGFIHRLLGWDLEEFFNNYPIWIQYPDADVYHLTSQNLATIIHFRKPPGHTLITVHDLIPWILRNDPQIPVNFNKIHIFFDWLALKGINRIEWVITSSHHSAGALIILFNRKPSLIKTLDLGID